MDRIDHRVAIVTGGTQSIGAAISTTLARAGYHVAAGYSANQTAAPTVHREADRRWALPLGASGQRGEPGD